MGVNLRGIVKAKEITLMDLRGKAISIDAYNALYQFLAIIRQPDGTPLKDSQGRITSHLSGLLYRTVNLVENGIKPVYVFDGKPPELKAMEIERRKAVKEEAVKKYEEALARGDLEAARMYAQATSVLTEDMVNQAKRLLDLMGIPYVQAPSEGEAQAAYMAKKGDVFACGSQDYDSLLFGAPRLVRNISITGRRKLPRKNVYIEVKPELIVLDEILKDLGISREQLIDIAILVGTDYNPEGIKGIGPKKALALIKQYGSLEKALKHIPGASFPVDPMEIKEIFLKPQVTDSYEVKWRQPDIEGVVRFLCGEHDFSESRVRKAVEKLDKAMKETKTRTSLDMWFKK
ncbi:MAG: flap endonuclease-1 [Candidatus Baldrarchaeota archaeon]|mgnify:CR=1 FL=1|nr:flap endonuclease-1 [Candidatus Baldrarchaeota archaeon]